MRRESNASSQKRKKYSSGENERQKETHRTYKNNIKMAEILLYQKLH